VSIETIKINIKKLIESGLTIESYFILECIYRDDNDSLESYVENCGKIDKSCFIDLIQKSYLMPIIGDVIFSKLKLTPKALNTLGYTKFLDHERFFKELKEVYPRKAGKRSLHQDLSGVKKKYKSIVDSEEMHIVILNCIRLYIKELKDTNRLEYIQLLPTFINQRNYEQYLEEASNITDNEETVDYNAI